MSLAVDPVSPDTLYAGTWNEIYKSVDGGSSWAIANTGLPSVRVRGIAIDPTTPSTLYATVNANGVYKSTDGAGTWTPANTGLTGSALQVYAMAIDPATPTTLYVGTWGSGVYRSIDGGASWQPRSSGLTTLYLNALAVDPVTPTTLYAGTSWTGVFKSIDAGATWNQIPSEISQADVWTIAIDPTSPSTLYAGTGRGLYTSTDGAGTWTKIYDDGTGLLVIDPLATAHLYAPLPRLGLSQSTDAGVTWQQISHGLAALHMTAIVPDPKTLTTLYAATDHWGVFKSTDGGSTWGAVNSGLENYAMVESLALDPVTPSVLYAGTDYGGVFKSIDGGSTWTSANSGLLNETVLALAVDPVTTSTVYAGTYGTDGGVYKSTDAGASWTLVNSGMAADRIMALAVDPQTPATVYAGTEGSGLFKSTNGGTSWTAINTGLSTPTVLSLAIDPATPSTLYAGGYGWGNNLFKSTDGGASWTTVHNGSGSGSVYTLVVDPANPATLFAGTEFGGVLRSTDGGSTWTTINEGLSNPLIECLALDPSSSANLFAGTEGNSIFKYTCCLFTCTADVPATTNAGVSVSFKGDYSPCFSWNLGDGTFSKEAEHQHSYVSPGTYVWTMGVSAGGASCSKTGSISISNVPPPVISSMAKQSSPFRITVNGSNLQNGIRVFINGTEFSGVTWKSTSKIKLSGSTLKAVVPKGASTTFRFVNPDGGEATLTWSYLAESLSETDPCTFTCSASVPAIGNAGTSVAFSAEATPCYLWDFGDGGTSNGQEPTHAYAASGTYTWLMTVWVGGAACTKTGEITVGNVPPPVISSMAKQSSPFRITVNGSNLQNGIRVFIDGTEFTGVTWKSTAKIKLSGPTLKTVVPKGVSTTFRFVNPDGGEVTTTWSY